MCQSSLDYHSTKGDSTVKIMINSSDSGLETPPNSSPNNAGQKSAAEVIDVESYISNDKKDLESDCVSSSQGKTDSLSRKRKIPHIDDMSVARTRKILKNDDDILQDYKSSKDVDHQIDKMKDIIGGHSQHSTSEESSKSGSHDLKTKIESRSKKTGKISNSKGENNKIKIDLEKKQRELKKQKLEAEKELKKKKLEEERTLKRQRVEEQKELKRKRIEEEKELKRKKVAEEKELKRKRLEEEKEQRRKKIEAEKMERELKKKKLEEERELKKRKLEEEKELKRKKIEAEKLQKKRLEESKERSQSKISSFFSVSKKVGSSSTKKTDYNSTFLNFNLKDSCYLMPRNVLNDNQLQQSIKMFDEAMQKNCYQKHETVESWLCGNQLSGNNNGKNNIRHRGFRLIKTAENVVSSINSENLDENEIFQLLQELPIKYVQFYENVRPPYCGTYTKQDSNSESISALQLEPAVESRTSGSYDCIFKDPFSKLPNVDYSYDSDVEWNAEDDEDGGEIDDLDDDDEDDDDEGLTGSNDENNSDLDSFVDDEDDSLSMNTSKKIMIGKLTPIVKTFDNASTDNREVSMDNSIMASMVVPNLEFPIDPFKDYCFSDKANNNAKNIPALITKKAGNTTPNKNSSELLGLVSSEKIQNKAETSNGAQKNNSISGKTNITANKITNILISRKKTKTVITNEEELRNFIKFVNDNNDFTTSTLVEILKKRFSSYTKIIVRNTLEQVASKRGPKATEKVWVINDEFLSFLNSA